MTVRATVVPVPTLGATPTALSNFSTVFGAASTNQSFNLSASNLLGLANLSVTNGYEISLSTNSGFATNLAVSGISASDNAANYTTATWTNGANQGTGFSPWQSPGSAGTGGFNGQFIGSASNNGVPIANYAPLYTGGVAFSVYAGGADNAFQDALRPFNYPMADGETLNHSLAITFDNGNKGFTLLNGTTEVFFFNVNNTGYSWSGGGSAPSTPWPGVRENGVVINFAVTRTPSGFNYAISSAQDVNLNRTGSVAAAGITALKYYISGAGDGDGGNLFFNNLQLSGAGGNISNLPVYVRIGTNAPVAEVTNSLVSTVTISSTNAANSSVNLSGTVADRPLITQTSSFVSFFALQGFPSAGQTFKVGGNNLNSDGVLVTAPAGYEVSTNATSWSGTVVVPRQGAVTPQSDVFLRLAAGAPLGANNGNIQLSSSGADNVSIPVVGQVADNTGAQLSAAPASLPSFVTETGAFSTVQTFLLTGQGLSNSVAVSAPAGFQISTNGTDFFTNGAISPPPSGFVSNTISVRLSGSAPGIFSGNVSATSGAASAVSSVRGTVFAAGAGIAASPLALSNFTTVQGTPSASQSFQVAARDLGSANLLAVPTTGYEVSTNSTGSFTNSLSLASVAGAVDPVALFVRISSNAITTNSLAGSVSLSGGSAAPVSVTLSGKVDPARPLSVTLTAPTNNPAIIAPGATIRLSALVSDTNSSGAPVNIASFQFRTNNVAIPGATVSNVVSPYTLTFDWTPAAGSLPATVTAWAVDVDGWEGSSAPVVVRNPSQGEPVVGFSPPVANGTVEAVTPATGGSFYVGGQFTTLNSAPAPRVARILANGSVDPEFHTGGSGPNAAVKALGAATNGLYIGGWFTEVSGTPSAAFARLNVGRPGTVDGTLDSAFVPSPPLSAASVGSSPSVEVVAVQFDGKILVGGNFRVSSGTSEWINLARYNPDGTLDETFGGNVIDPETQVATFQPPNPNGTVNAIALQPDGKILVGGAFARIGAVPNRGLARLERAGSLDTTLVIGAAGFSGPVQAVAVAPDAQIYVGGLFSSFNNRFTYNNLVRLSSTGVLDGRFNFGGGLNGSVSGLLIRPGGEILAAGSFTSVANSVLGFGPVAAGRVLQLLNSGLPDPNFNQGGSAANNTVHEASLLANGNLVLVGAFSTYNGEPRGRITVLAGSATAAPVVTSPWFVTVEAGMPLDYSFTSSATGQVAYQLGPEIPGSPAGPLPWGVNSVAARISGVPLQAGRFAYSVRAVQNAGGPSEIVGSWSPFEIRVLPAPVSFDTWRGVWFTPAELLNPSISGPDASLANPSGLSNFAVYALSGGNPRILGPSIRPTTGFINDDEGVRYLRMLSGINPLANATYSVEYNATLTGPWQPVETVLLPDGNSVEGLAPVPAAGLRSQFLRMKIDQPPATTNP